MPYQQLDPRPMPPLEERQSPVMTAGPSLMSPQSITAIAPQDTSIGPDRSGFLFPTVAPPPQLEQPQANAEPAQQSELLKYYQDQQNQIKEMQALYGAKLSRDLGIAHRDPNDINSPLVPASGNFATHHPILTGLLGGAAIGGLNYLQTGNAGQSLGYGVLGGALAPFIGKKMNEQRHGQEFLQYLELQKNNYARLKELQDLQKPLNDTGIAIARQNQMRTAGQLPPNTPTIDPNGAYDPEALKPVLNNGDYRSRYNIDSLNRILHPQPNAVGGKAGVLQGGVTGENPLDAPINVPDTEITNNSSNAIAAFKAQLEAANRLRELNQNELRDKGLNQLTQAQITASQAETNQKNRLLPGALGIQQAGIAGTNATTRKTITETGQIVPNGIATRAGHAASTASSIANAGLAKAHTADITNPMGKPPTFADLKDQQSLLSTYGRQNGFYTLNDKGVPIGITTDPNIRRREDFKSFIKANTGLQDNAKRLSYLKLSHIEDGYKQLQSDINNKLASTASSALSYSPKSPDLIQSVNSFFGGKK